MCNPIQSGGAESARNDLKRLDLFQYSAKRCQTELREFIKKKKDL